MGIILSIFCPPKTNQIPKEKEIVRFFMIGTGAAGKTTVVRQLKCLCKERPKHYKAYDNDWNLIQPDNIFTEEEMMRFRKIIRINIATAVYNLIQQTLQWGRQCKAEESAQNIIQLVERAELEGRGKFNMNIPVSIGHDLVEVLMDPNVSNGLLLLNNCFLF
ncbi:unnamed protein product [Strongylus vulgaris]|uniref:Uncharacterized protein n=1 Tax=Strongylus vulgaris TaxID=40348 RepID=A0A3P7IML8_STRVU|nr:unnamed protein product [Strongylus vulgaris]